MVKQRESSEVVKDRIIKVASKLFAQYGVKDVSIRSILLDSLAAHNNTMRLIVRAGLDGLSPESYIDENSERAANILAKWIASHQVNKQLPDAKLTSVG